MDNEKKKSKRQFKKIILDDLEREGKSYLARKVTSVRYESFSMGSAVRIVTQDMFKDEREEMQRFLRRYEYGSFDGMTDCYHVDNRREDVERQAKFVTMENKFSPIVEQICAAYLSSVCDITDDKTAQDKRGERYAIILWRETCKVSSFGELDARLRMVEHNRKVRDEKLASEAIA